MAEGLDIHTDKKVYSIPEGLNELMYDISKEVLRSQPKNIYKFISEYLITLLKVREAVKVAVPIIEREFETAESQLNFLNKYNLSKEQGDRFATIIQAAFRGYRTRKRLLHLADDFVVKEEVARSDSVIEQDATTDPVLSDLKTRGVPFSQTVEAATKIQAFYRGYKVRKMEQEKGIECLIHEIPSHESWRHDWLNELPTKKHSGIEINQLRKDFVNFHKHLSRQYEGDRLHIETIFGGKYEDYNWVCDLNSCQEFIVPTPGEARELAVPGALEPSVSELLDVPGGPMMQKMVSTKIKESSVSYDKADKERMFFEVLEPKKSPVEEVQEKSSIKGSQPTPTGTASQARSSKTPSIASTPRSEGSKRSRTSKKSGSKASIKGEQASATPELSVRSLTGVDEEARESAIPDETGDVSVGEVSDVSTTAEELKQESKKSVRSSKGSIAPGPEKAERLSQKSLKSGGSKASLKSGSKKSAVEVAAEQSPEPPQEEPQAE